MRSDQTVCEMVEEVLRRQGRSRAARSGERFEEAMTAVLETEAGQQLRELGDGEYRDKKATEWQKGLSGERNSRLVEHLAQSTVSRPSEVSPSRVADHHYSWLESYLERSEGKEKREEYYALVEQELGAP